MNRILTFSGYCPEQDKDYSVKVTYLDASTLSEKSYIRGSAKCEYAAFKKCSHAVDCPIVKSAPENL